MMLSRNKRTVVMKNPRTYYKTEVFSSEKCPECGKKVHMNWLRYTPGKHGHQIQTFECPHCGANGNVIFPFDIIVSITDNTSCPIDWVSSDGEWYIFIDDPDNYQIYEDNPCMGLLYVGCPEFTTLSAIFKDGTITHCDGGGGPDPDFRSIIPNEVILQAESMLKTIYRRNIR